MRYAIRKSKARFLTVMPSGSYSAFVMPFCGEVSVKAAEMDLDIYVNG